MLGKYSSLNYAPAFHPRLFKDISQKSIYFLKFLNLGLNYSGY